MSTIFSQLHPDDLKQREEVFREMIRTGVSFVVDEAEVRAMAEDYIDLILQMRDAMVERGIQEAPTTQMLTELFHRYDEAVKG